MTTAITAAYDPHAAKLAAMANALRMIDRSRGFEKPLAVYEADAVASLNKIAATPRPLTSLNAPWIVSWAGPSEQDEWAADYRSAAL